MHTSTTLRQNKFRGMKLSQFHGWDLNSAILKCSQKLFFLNQELKMLQKKNFKNSSVKIKCLQKYIFPLKSRMEKKPASLTT